ncbi:uncharacterized mitochondrial protein AtMg00810-like [Lathyrus oleraceus]|uniref:uncharacterized mitochondrial protein AtMg00810-like n=1 Tax=Pisum sativum TaxID=3888 RepID=UPI0021D00EC2|nr:uncharacterized mitochondrial protein AtMg00810-like [Pisum sativum]
MDVRNAFLNRCLDVEVIQDVGNDVNNMKGVIMKDNENLMIVQIYVDDIVEFEMSMVCKLTYFLGFPVKQMNDGIFISQSKYARNIMKKYGLKNGWHKHISTITLVKLSKDEQRVNVDKILYKSMVGFLLYLTGSLPDNNLLIGVCALFQANPRLLILLKNKL